MKTRLVEFCGDLEVVSRPLIAPLETLIGQLELQPGSGARPDVSQAGELAALRDVRHRLATLLQKMEQQQAYVIIFGPLKSGKSTLMNALTGAYVSEVTALPAYPCMVHVSHADKPGFTITRFDGTTEVLDDAEALHQKVSDAHHRLSQHIRAVESKAAAEGTGVFDPQVHYPQAIRKVDVHLPAGDLEASGAVLVDTPGLYSRMKFGYDRMTRDFRDTAACAVFVVKAENLFLEQVFAEFHQLVEIFGRTYLVVNVDGNKRDLQPDGSLVPSLEGRNPQAIIEAFETLSMSAPLKDALESGRLRIYPVDLLRAASQRLKGSEGGTAKKRGKSGTGFDAFHHDLSQHLNSIEYLHTFVSDAVRYAQHLAHDTTTVTHGGRADLLRDRQETLKARRTWLEERTAALRKLVDLQWDKVFEPGLARWRERIAGFAATEREEIEDDLEQRLTGWYRDDRSLSALYDAEFGQLSERITLNMTRGSRRLLNEQLGQLVSARDGGFELESAIREVLAECDLDIVTLVREYLGEHPPLEEVDIEPPGFVWDVAAIPLHKRLVDWLLFRSEAQLRANLLGVDEDLGRDIPSADKLQYLIRRGRQAITVQMLEPLKTAVENTQGRLTDEAERLVAAVAGLMNRRVNDDFESARQELQEVRERLALVHDTLATIDHIDTAVAKIDEDLETLAGKFALESLVIGDGE